MIDIEVLSKRFYRHFFRDSIVLEMVNILLCCTGSVATIKVPELLERLRAHPDTVVRLVVSENSKHFLPPLSSLGVVGDSVLCDQDEWDSW